MKRILNLLSPVLFALPVCGEVEVFIEDVGGKAVIKYQCTAGEVVRAFALDVTVDGGAIAEVSQFFVGESTSAAQGYGLFPASYRDEGFTWSAPGYSPLAVVSDAPADTQAGLGTSGVTLELGGLWQPGDAAAVPPSTGVLCALTITQAANVSLALNASRGGVQFAPPEATAAVVLTGAFVDPGQAAPRILDIWISGSDVNVLFEGGELFWSPDAGPPWTGTGDSDGSYTESIFGQTRRFFRVHGSN